MKPNRFTLTIPGKPVISLNSYLRSHWTVRSRTKQKWVNQVAEAGIAAVAIAQAKGQRIYLFDVLANGQPRRVRLEFYFPDSRRRDPDNYLKVMLDALVRNGYLTDDSPDYCKAEAVFRTDKNNPRTEIHIEPMESED